MYEMSMRNSEGSCADAPLRYALRSDHMDEDDTSRASRGPLLKLKGE